MDLDDVVTSLHPLHIEPRLFSHGAVSVGMRMRLW